MPTQHADDDEELTPEEIRELQTKEQQAAEVLKDRAVLVLAGPIRQAHMGICYELLNYHYRDDFDDHITLVINSPGGSCAIGWAIVDTMNFIRHPVNTVCVGIAASMAADIFVNGDHRTMGEHSTLMIHPHSSLSMGSHSKLIANIKGDVIEHNRRIHHYLSNSKYKTLEKVEATLTGTKGDEVYLTPQETLQHGLADEIAYSSKKNKRRKKPAKGSSLIS